MQRILYVEDDLSLIDGLQYTLEASGYMVDNAKTVKEALALFRKNTYDLLLSVYIRRLRNKIEDTPNQPKYLLTERGIGYKWVVE